jgi:hypothetical protein
MELLHFQADQSHPLALIIRRLPHLDLSRGPWVAGGAARRLFAREMLAGGDIDVFSKSALLAQDFMENLGRVGCVEMADLEIKKNRNFEMCFGSSGLLRATIQVVRSRTAPTLIDLFESFDFTVCCFATDGRTIVTTPQAVSDLEGRWLRPANPAKKPTSMIGARIIKYTGYGFTPAPDLLPWMLGPDGHTDVSDDLAMVCSGDY